MVSLTEPAKADLVWWATHLKLCNGKSFFPGNPDLIIFSDASLTGWGAVCDGSRSKGPWTSADAERHINELELLAAYFSLQAFANSSKNISIQLFLDNSTAVAYINKCGGTHSKALSIPAAQIIHWCEARSIQILASHLPGNSGCVFQPNISRMLLIINMHSNRDSSSIGFNQSMMSCPTSPRLRPSLTSFEILTHLSPKAKS
jgi:hypothetical protein